MRQLATSLLIDPVAIEVAPRNAAAEAVEQQVYRVPKEHKRHLLAHLIEDGNWHQVLVFTRTKHGANANRLTQPLEACGIRATAIHGNKSQAARVRALEDFKANRVTALVATEVAARGLDIKELPQVVNYELPNVPEDYIHRIGRTARAGASGRAVSLVSPDETPQLKDIERLLKRGLPVATLPAYPVPAATAVAQGTGEAPERPRGERPHHARSGQRSGGGQRSNSAQHRNAPRGAAQRGTAQRSDAQRDRAQHGNGASSWHSAPRGRR
jgi:ATP-dependent RNA helicase RhlE